MYIRGFLRRSAPGFVPGKKIRELIIEIVVGADSVAWSGLVDLAFLSWFQSQDSLSVALPSLTHVCLSSFRHSNFVIRHSFEASSFSFFEFAKWNSIASLTCRSQ
jgi:hypothetical protein